MKSQFILCLSLSCLSTFIIYKYISKYRNSNRENSDKISNENKDNESYYSYDLTENTDNIDNKYIIDESSEDDSYVSSNDFSYECSTDFSEESYDSTNEI